MNDLMALSAFGLDSDANAHESQARLSTRHLPVRENANGFILVTKFGID